MSKNFNDLIASEKPVLIDFYADWCAPCRAMGPVLKDLKAQMGDNVSIFKIDVEKYPAIAQKYQVQSIPTFILFKKGSALWRKSGMASSAELQRTVEAASN